MSINKLYTNKYTQIRRYKYIVFLCENINNVVNYFYISERLTSEEVFDMTQPLQQICLLFFEGIDAYNLEGKNNQQIKIS